MSKPIDAPYPYPITLALRLNVRGRRDKPGDDAGCVMQRDRNRLAVPLRLEGRDLGQISDR